MKNRNCPNCGAVFNEESNKCAYCGTLYYDLSVIPLNNPFYLTLNLGTDTNPRLVTAKVITNNVEFTQTPQCLYGRSITDKIKNPIFTSMLQEFDMTFMVVGDEVKIIE